MTSHAETQVDLAKERTHAAWVRTCLTFIVTIIAVRHYSDETGEMLVTGALSTGGAVAAIRAAFLAPDIVSKFVAISLVPVAVGALFIHI